jgi:hypothetical protein
MDGKQKFPNMFIPQEKVPHMLASVSFYFTPWQKLR